MLQQHRARIDQCRDILVQRLDITSLWPKLLEHKIFNPDDVNISRWQQTLSASVTKNEILTTIKTRGPHAFDNLLKSLGEIGQTELAALLQGCVVDTATNNNVNNDLNTSLNLPQNIPDRLPPSNCQNNAVENLDEVNNLLDNLRVSDEEPVVIRVRKSTIFLDETDGPIGRYPMRSKPRGLVLVITLMNYALTKKLRQAAEYDHYNLVELFQQMGFEVIHKQDLTARGIRREVFEFSQKKELRKVDSCFVIISGHGNKSADGKTVIYGVDDTGNHHPDHEISCLEIVQFFSVTRCPMLARKPKIFIFQSCRGESSQYAVMDRGGSCVRYNDDIRIPNEDPRGCGTRDISDILIAHSTLPGYVSFRDKYCGSWFIQTLCKVFMLMASHLPIHDLFNKIDELIGSLRTLRNECQTTTVKSIGFSKHLYINPGLFLEE